MQPFTTPRAVSLLQAGQAFAAAGDDLRAADAYLGAVRADPACAPAWIYLSARLHALGQPEAAREAASLAVRADPRLARAHLALGNALHDLGAFAEAIACYRRALGRIGPGAQSAAESAPDATIISAAALTNLARSLEAAGALAEALEACEQAIAARPDWPEPRLGRATALLASGDFAQGWPAYAARWALPGSRMPDFAMPLWTGEKLAGRAILLHAEQGFGDVLQSVRFTANVAARGGRVHLAVPQPLLRLCAGLVDVAHIHAIGAPLPADLPNVDLHCPLMNLPAIFLAHERDLAPAKPYLHADPTLIAARPVPPAPGRRVGLIWAGDSRPGLPHAHVMDRRRSLPLAAFAPLAPLCAAGQISLYSLQIGPAAAQCAEAPPALALRDIAAGVTDFADSAALMAQLDLIIAVDTAGAHLAAALGRPTWLLSRYDACWRWMRDRADSPWYPTMRIFRQTVPGQWDDVVAGVKEALLF